MTESPVFTPRETVSELDRYIIGQKKAKRAVALALRNRWRRQRVGDDLRDDISPKNIIMIGPTGVGKTEIARRLAKLSKAPFIKVEASKFTEVGYVGRDVESIIRDLTALAITEVKVEETDRLHALAKKRAEERVLDLLSEKRSTGEPERQSSYFSVGPQGGVVQTQVTAKERESLRVQLREGALDDREVTIKVMTASQMPFEIMSGPGMEDMMSQIQDAFGQMGRGQEKEKTLKVPDALKVFVEEEADRLVDKERIKEIALERVQQSGVVFLDEIDKIALSSGRGGSGGADVSRGGVQRDLLPIVEGSAVNTKFGTIRTDHILFIAAGAFHETKVSDLIPELQGRFPIRVELEALTQDDFYLILKEPKNSLIRQYSALLETEGVTLHWTENGLRALAQFAFDANTRLENIGARRLHTVLETLLEEVSFNAPEQRGQDITIDEQLVKTRLGDILEDEDLSRYIL